ncbi:MAG TPA: hypothetical protein VF412_00280 [Bdellovibrio sp.]|uniref:hypothetical protein n=1 Tax=Bdellovibrio sp. TaxID=28201 RepID=UPI002EF50348
MLHNGQTELPLDLSHTIPNISATIGLQALIFKLRMYDYFIKYAAIFTAATFALWLYYVVAVYRKILINKFKKHWTGLIASFALAGIIFSFVPVGFKVLSDETNLLSVSRMIATRFYSVNNVQGIYLANGGYEHIQNEIPTRPLMFPFLTACLHWLFGVATKNIFTLNFLLFAALLFTAYCLLEKKNLFVRLLIITLLAFNGSVAIHAASAGFDLCSLVFGIWTFMALWIYMQNPNQETLTGLALTCITFAQIRYESMMIFIFVAVALYADRKKELLKDIKGNWILIFSPLLLLPAIVQRCLTWNQFENDPKDAPFSLGHILKHAPEFAQYMFLEYKSVYSVFLDVLGLVGIYFVARAMTKNRKDKIFFMTSFLYGLFIALLLLAHHFGRAGFSTQYRLFMPLSVLLILAAAFAFSEGKKKIAILTVVCLVQFYFSLQYLRKDPIQLMMGKEMNLITEYLDRTKFDRPLFIFRRPGQIISVGYSAIMPSYYHKELKRIEGYLKDHTVNSIYEFALASPTVHLNETDGLTAGWTRILVDSMPMTPALSVDVYALIYDPEKATSAKIR